MTTFTSSVPDSRVTTLNPSPIRADRPWVLYWMVTARRTSFNLALERSADYARHLGRPLLVLEALRCDYPWASDRLHRFILDGMADNRRALQRRNAVYFPFVELEKGAGRGLLAELATRAAVVITDDYPTFFLPRMAASAAARADVRFEAVDGNGLLPMRLRTGRLRPPTPSDDWSSDSSRPPRVDAARDPLQDLPRPSRSLPMCSDRWPPHRSELLDGDEQASHDSPRPHVAPTAVRGGAPAPRSVLDDFLDDRLDCYADHRNRPDDDATSGLSPYLHFGHFLHTKCFSR